MVEQKLSLRLALIDPGRVKILQLLHYHDQINCHQCSFLPIIETNEPAKLSLTLANFMIINIVIFFAIFRRDTKDTEWIRILTLLDVGTKAKYKMKMEKNL